MKIHNWIESAYGGEVRHKAYRVLNFIYDVFRLASHTVLWTEGQDRRRRKSWDIFRFIKLFTSALYLRIPFREGWKSGKCDSSISRPLLRTKQEKFSPEKRRRLQKGVVTNVPYPIVYFYMHLASCEAFMFNGYIREYRDVTDLQ